jgi:pilus assembly protein FimV
MSWKLRVIVAAMLLAPQAVLALGLGDIRLGSALNEPLSAEIDLVAATPDELSVLQAQLASRELFQRYGLERPAYLDTLEFTVGRGQDGRSVLLVRSRDSISEPFLSFLVDVSWPRGRLLREYTVLLDPPVFTPPSEQPAAAAVVAPRTESAPAQVTPEPAAAPPAPAPTAATGTMAGAPSTYRVENGDTLYEIARGLTDGSRPAMQQMMIGLFRANPEAFNGNINVLRAGAILRVPAADEVAAIEAGDAASEVSRQISAWRAASGAPESGRLRLVTPEEGVADAGAGEPAASGTVESQVEALERDIEQQRRLLELKNQELAELQREMAREKAAEEAVAAESAAQAPGEAAVRPEDDAGAVPPAEPAEKPAVAAKPKPEAAPAAEKSFFDSLTDNWLFLLGAAALLLAGVVGYGYVRRRRDVDVDEALKSFDVPATAPVPTETVRLRALAGGAGAAAATAGADIVVEERPPARAREEIARPAAPEETISAEAALDLDQADPLAEADFHMAYGLYDQASELVKMALKHAPDRDDLKMKLAEIHFVAGETPKFLAVARDLRNSIGDGADWDRIVIMGRQLAPDDPLFAGGVKSAGVDLSLEGGDSRVDLDLLSTPDGEEGLDLDLGQVLAASDSNAITSEGQALEFNLDEGPPTPGTTQEITQRNGPGTVELPTVELPSSEAPTVESPALRRRGGDTVRERIGGREHSSGISADSTAEMAITDLGLDVSGLSHLLDEEEATTMESPRPDDATRIAQGDAGTRMMPSGSADDDGTAMLPEIDSEGTAMLAQLDAGDGVEIDLDVGAADSHDAETTATTRLPADQMPQLSELEPVTMSEVGTKLDLARAYMDMGDPDGARNILQEVLAEGSASQKQEARRLIDSLPGA